MLPEVLRSLPLPCVILKPTPARPQFLERSTRMTKLTIRLYALLALAFFASAAPAQAQFARRTQSDPATGEQYHIEGAAGFWRPTADMSIQSESLGIPGSTIDFKNDLGLTDTHFSEVQAVLRPGKKHRFRFQFIPIKYDQEHTLTRTIVFNGQQYTVGVPVISSLKWNAYRFGYEYDFLYHDRWFAGFMLETKYTDVRADLKIAPPSTTSEFAHARGPIPAIGGIVRVYVMPNISITGELSGIDIPKIQDKYKAHYADFDMYGTLNVINNLGVQLGYRSLDVGYLFNTDTGNFTLKGLYFGVVARY